MTRQTEMRLLPGGVFRMGSDRHYPDEAPARTVQVDAFWIDLTPVTNAEFARFVDPRFSSSFWRRVTNG